VKRSNDPASYFNRQPPCDVQAEVGVLGSVVLLPNVLDDVATIVRPEDFYDDAHSKLFALFTDLHGAGKPLDVTILVDRLRASGCLETIGGTAYLSKIINAVPNAAHAAHYAGIVREKSRLREIIVRATEALHDAYHELPAEDVAARLEMGLSSLSHSQAAEAKTLGEFATEALQESVAASEKKIVAGVMTGMAGVDTAMGPIMAGDLATLAARPGMGKSALAVQLAVHNAQRGRRSLIVSLEMKGTELARRELASIAAVDGRDVRLGRLSDQDRSRLNEACRQLSEIPVYLWSPASATLADIRAQARHAKARGGLDLLVVDYVGLVSPSRDEKKLPEHERISIISTGLKRLAKELSIPVLMLSQLNRETESQHEPRLSNLAKSGAIEQDSDLVIFLHHSPPGKPSRTGQAAVSVDAHEAWLLIAKNRHGEVGKVRLNWIPKETRFECPTSF
jgi:replicative DNA helicase